MCSPSSIAGRANTVDIFYQTSYNVASSTPALSGHLRLLDPLQQQTIQKQLKEHCPVNPSQISPEGRTRQVINAVYIQGIYHPLATTPTFI